MPVTRRMRLMEGAATLGGVLTHHVMDNVMEHLSLTDCIHLRGVSKELRDSAIIVSRLNWTKVLWMTLRLFFEWDCLFCLVYSLNDDDMPLDPPDDKILQIDFEHANEDFENSCDEMVRVFDTLKGYLPSTDLKQAEPLIYDWRLVRLRDAGEYSPRTWAEDEINTWELFYEEYHDVFGERAGVRV